MYRNQKHYPLLAGNYIYYHELQFNILEVSENA